MSNPNRILLIDDSSEEYEFLKFAIDKFNYNIEVDFAPDCETAINKLSAASAANPDIVAMDWNMPRIAGDECLSYLKNISHVAAVPIVILSGDIQENKKKLATEMGISSFFIKPNNLREYQAILPEILKLIKLPD